MNYATIKKNDVANGQGIRVSLFVSGCRHGCRGCFNREAWDFSYGEKYTKDTEREILDSCAPEYIDGLSILGGEPFEPENQADVAELLSNFHRMFPEKSVWCYTGFTLDEIMGESRAHTDKSDKILSFVDVLVDGRFIEEKKDLSLRFKGSSNQRVIDMKKSIDKPNPVLWSDADEQVDFSEKVKENKI